MTQEHFDEAFDFAASLAEQRRRRDEEERRTDPIYGLPCESPDEWYARRLREVREKNFHNLDVAENIKPPPGRMVPRFDKPPSKCDWTLIATREYETLRQLEEVASVFADQSHVLRLALDAVKKARQP
jgi:hypothetical protein